MTVYCRICGAAGAVCGDSHQTLPLLTGDAFHRGATMTTTEPEELGEYHYYVSGMEMTAQMTPSMAEKMGAVPVDEPLDEDPDTLENNEANRLSSHMQDANERGVTHKARQPRKQREQRD